MLHSDDAEMEKKVAPDWCAIAFPIRVLPAQSNTAGWVRLGWVGLQTDAWKCLRLLFLTQKTGHENQREAVVAQKLSMKINARLSLDKN